MNAGNYSVAQLAVLAIASVTLASPIAGNAQDGASFLAKRDDLSAKDILRVEKVIKPTADFSKPENFEIKQGGAATSTKKVSRNSFSHFSDNLSFEEERDFKLGNGLFRKIWVSSPSSTQASDGLGPLFNARACQHCHLKDGRGHPPEGDDDATSMFLRLARPAKTEQDNKLLVESGGLNLPDPTYGGQLQDFAVPGLQAEGDMVISYDEVPVDLADGTRILLRKPSYSVANLGFGPLHKDTTLSPRVTPQMIGLGLLEAIHEADLVNQADPDDADGDGISGKLSIVGSEIGRFGWKASNPTVLQQSAGAFAGDIGLSSPYAPRHHGDCTENQLECLQMATGVQERLGDTEAPDPVLDLVVFYSKNLAVPARRDVADPLVLRGKEQFYALGCVSCHRPKFVTSRDADDKNHAFQLIWPYTDLLLHDMGEGLADGQAVGSANGQEWRTAPLWGTGLTETVNGHSFFLHDGRARNRTEAILWHGGEAQEARDGFAALEQSDREALIKFLESL